jgi:gliding motility-associated-like protein
MFDYETKTSYTIRVKSLLINNMFTEKSFVINIKDQNEKPFLLSISKDSVNENTKDSTFIGILSTQDFDVNDKFNYTLISSNSNSDISNFAINGSALFLIKTLNFETQNVYNLIIRTTDSGGLTLDSTIVIYVKDINEKPILIFQEYEISELAAKDSVIGTVTFTDQDLNQNYKFELSDTTLPFSIDTSGVLRLNGSIDYESKNEFEVWVRIIDNGNPNLVDSIKQIIHIIDEIELSELPSANLVTPNDDGYNDVWKINNVHLYKDFSLDIVDEYGQSVYAVSNNYNNDWDAKISGKSLPSGLYYYVFKNNMNGKLFKGNITVIK